MKKDIFQFWSQINPKTFVHPADKEVFARYKGHAFNLKCLPSPMAGNLREAPVVLLYLSPGLHKEDLSIAKSSAGQKLYIKSRQGRGALPTPEENFAGWKWWSGRTKWFGNWNMLRNKIAVLNIGAYHSVTFKDHDMLASLPSSRVSLEYAQDILFPQAIRGERIVICMRARKFWGLGEGRRKFGKSLYAPEVTRGGHMKESPLRDEIIRKVKSKLNNS